MNARLKYGECPKCHRALTEGHECGVLPVREEIISGMVKAFMKRIRENEKQIERLTAELSKNAHDD